MNFLFQGRNVFPHAGSLHISPLFLFPAPSSAPGPRRQGEETSGAPTMEHRSHQSRLRGSRVHRVCRGQATRTAPGTTPTQPSPGPVLPLGLEIIASFKRTGGAHAQTLSGALWKHSFVTWHFQTSWHKMQSDIWSLVCGGAITRATSVGSGSPAGGLSADKLRARAGLSGWRPHNDRSRARWWPPAAGPAAGSRS